MESRSMETKHGNTPQRSFQCRPKYIIENLQSLWCQLCCHWWHRPPVTAKLASWWLSVYSDDLGSALLRFVLALLTVRRFMWWGTLIFRIDPFSTPHLSQPYLCRSQIVLGNVKYVCIFYHFSTLRWPWQLESFPVKDKYPFILHNLCHAWLLMTWLHQEHQQPQYWPSLPGIFRGWEYCHWFMILHNCPQILAR